MRILRITSQWVFVLVFLALFFLPVITRNKLHVATDCFFWFDPLFLAGSLLAAKTLLSVAFLALIPLLLTLLSGRFFCGWICPMGSIHQFVSWVFHRFRPSFHGPDKKMLGLKYLVLVILAVPLLFGISLTGWLDPFSLLTRSLSVFTPLEDNGHASALPFLTGGFFILLLALNAWRPRFFCNALCPLGALYGIMARFSQFRFTAAPSCNRCLTCSTHCTFGGDAGEGFLKTECLVCFNCVADCPTGSVDVTLKRQQEKETAPEVIPGRRKFLGALALGTGLALLPGMARPTGRNTRHSFLRPPGATGEDEFLSRCVRCGQCIQSCPTGFIQPAAIQAGVEGIWTPVVNGLSGYCAWDCTACTQTCPSGAIVPLTLKEKQRFRIGTAVIDQDRCFTYADGYTCTVCEEKCPTPDKAIKFRVAEVWNYKGKRSVVNQAYVDPDLCTGCGICEYHCPRRDTPAIYLVSEDEYREIRAGR